MGVGDLRSAGNVASIMAWWTWVTVRVDSLWISTHMAYKLLLWYSVGQKIPCNGWVYWELACGGYQSIHHNSSWPSRGGFWCSFLWNTLHNKLYIHTCSTHLKLTFIRKLSKPSLISIFHAPLRDLGQLLSNVLGSYIVHNIWTEYHYTVHQIWYVPCHVSKELSSFRSFFT